MLKSTIRRVCMPLFLAAISGLSTLPAYAHTAIPLHTAIKPSAQVTGQVISGHVVSVEKKS